jgi:16S rRNA (guanine527-N7)-methyltransferase
MMQFTQYFPQFSETQLTQFAALRDLYTEWNAKINVISRKDIDDLYEHHVQHSLAIASFAEERLGGFAAGTSLMDLGTGGGFPGIPLAIAYPECRFMLVDRIGKKVRVAQEVAHAIGLTNVEFRHAGAEELKDTYDYVVSRAVMPLPDLLKIVRRKMTRGLICLKGGDLTEELQPTLCRGAEVVEIARYFREPFFETKRVVYVPAAVK